jgi:hypothetical protein
MRSLLLSFLCVFLFMLPKDTFAQIYNWGVLTGNNVPNYEAATSITQDNSGNIITCGWFNGNVFLEPGGSASIILQSMNASAFISKSTPSGTLIWAKKLEGNSYTSINAVVTDAAGNVYVTGEHAGQTDFDPNAGVATLASPGSSSNMFVAKYDSNGNYVWANTAGSSGNTDAGYTIALDNQNNVIVGGHFTGTAYFDPQLGAGGSLNAISSLDAFVVKYNNNGNFVWVKGWNPAKCRELTTDASGNIYVFSQFNAPFDANPGTAVTNLTPVGDEDVFLIKLTPSGNLSWAKSLGSDGYESAGAIKCVGTNLFICGEYSDTLDMDFGANTNFLYTANNNSYLAKYDTAGHFSWAKRFGGDSTQVRFEGLDIAANGDITVVGAYRTYGGITIDTNPNAGVYPLSTNATQEAGLVIRLDANANFKNAFEIETTTRVVLYGAVSDANNNVYVAGFYTDSVYMDPSSSNISGISNGYEDILIAQYTFTPATNMNEIAPQSSFSLFPNPAKDNVFIKLDNPNLAISHIKIYNIKGESILNKELNGTIKGNIELALPSLAKGIYTVQMISKEGDVSNLRLSIE